MAAHIITIPNYRDRRFRYACSVEGVPAVVYWPAGHPPRLEIEHSGLPEHIDRVTIRGDSRLFWVVPEPLTAKEFLARAWYEIRRFFSLSGNVR